MAEAWFYFPGLTSAPARVTLSGEEAQHAAAARRLRPGDTVTLFDGAGTVAHADIVGAGARSVELVLHAAQRQPPPLPLHLACALPKGDRQATLLDMATQLGMTDFTPLRCAHSVVTPGPNSAARWQRLCLEACKQSRRAYLPRLHGALAPASVAAARGTLPVLIAHPDGVPFARLRAPLRAGAILLIGPEGGFTPEEVAAVRAAGGEAVALGPAVLRIETAATVLLALVAEQLRATTPG